MDKYPPRFVECCRKTCSRRAKVVKDDKPYCVPHYRVEMEETKPVDS